MVQHMELAYSWRQNSGVILVYQTASNPDSVAPVNFSPVK